jgi:2-hydroxychromene-2-carboxylate isomerase
MLRYALFVRNVDYDKIYRTSLEVIEGRFNTKDNIKENQIDQVNAGHHGVPLMVHKESYYFGQDNFDRLYLKYFIKGLKKL